MCAYQLRYIFREKKTSARPQGGALGVERVDYLARVNRGCVALYEGGEGPGVVDKVDDLPVAEDVVNRRS